MPKCQKCFKIFPPQFCEIISETDDYQCIFCKDNIDYIMYDNENGERKKYTKEDCINDYIKYLNMVKEKNDALLKEKRLNLIE